MEFTVFGSRLGSNAARDSRGLLSELVNTVELGAALERTVEGTNVNYRSYRV